MDLLTPGVGLIFWQLLIFGILFLFLSKYAWGPITKSLKEREKFISDSIKSAEKAEKELEKLNDKNKELVKKKLLNSLSNLERLGVRVPSMSKRKFVFFTTILIYDTNKTNLQVYSV